MNPLHLLAGFAEVEFTPEPGLPLLGQLHRRIATHARDPLCACAVAFRNGNSGQDDSQEDKQDENSTTIVFVSLDVCLLSNEFVAATQELWAKRTGLDPTSLMIHATHTHVAPALVRTVLLDPEPAFTERVQQATLDAAQLALDNLEPVEVFAARGYLEEMGWNRRAMFDDGTSRMYGHSEMPGFIDMEGPRDGDLPLLWTRNAQGDVTGVMVNFSTHPNCLEGECFYSADLPGAARKYLRRSLGEHIGVVYLTGAAGNTAPSILDPYNAEQPWRNEDGVERSGLYLAGEAVKVIATTLEPMVEPTLNIERTILNVPLRPWPEPGEPTYSEWADLEYYADTQKQWPERLRTESPHHVSLNAVRIGDAVICTNPAELFVEFGMQIKEAAPARVTFISELSDGWCGYVPTPKAFERGGFEAWCASWSQLSQTAGPEIVAATNELTHKLFEDGMERSGSNI